MQVGSLEIKDFQTMKVMEKGRGTEGGAQRAESMERRRRFFSKSLSGSKSRNENHIFIPRDASSRGDMPAVSIRGCGF